MVYDFNRDGQAPRSRRRGQAGTGGSAGMQSQGMTGRQAAGAVGGRGYSGNRGQRVQGTAGLPAPSLHGSIQTQPSSRNRKVYLDPSLENGGRKKMSRTKRRIITMVIAECFALLFIFGYGFWARTWKMIQRVDDWVPEEIQNQNFSVDLPQYQKQKGHWGIYIFGVDSRGSNVSKDTHSDVNLICDINHDTGEIRLVSVFRDSYLSINDKGDYNKINQAYFNGGPAEAAKALNKNLDLNIVDYMTFSWKAVADGINLLGGVDMEISRAEFAYINSFITETVQATGVYSQHLKAPGFQHLDGVQAVAYGRLRLMDTDYARTERQRKVIQAAFEKAKVADVKTLQQLAMVIFPQVATSVDMQDIINLVGDVGKYYIGETGGFPFARGDANMGRKGACVIPQTLESNVIELHQFLYGEDAYTPSDTVKQISTRISNDTGMFNRGVSIDHVSTSGGSVPQPIKPQKPAASATKEKTKTQENKDEEETGDKESDKDKGNTDENERPGESDGATSIPINPRPTSRPINEPVSRPGESDGSTSRPVSEPTSRPNSETISRPTNEPSNRPTSRPVSEPTAPRPTEKPSQSNEPVQQPGNDEAPSMRPGGTTPGTVTPTAPTAPSTNPGANDAPTVPALPGSSSTSPGNSVSPGNQISPGNSTSPGNSGTSGSPTSPGTASPSPVSPSPVPGGQTSVVIPDGQAVSYEGPPGA